MEGLESYLHIIPEPQEQMSDGCGGGEIGDQDVDGVGRCKIWKADLVQSGVVDLIVRPNDIVLIPCRSKKTVVVVRVVA